MFKELKNIEEYVYEEKSSFTSSDSPCYYLKKEFGFVVFFIVSKESVDYAVYDLNKNLISLVDNINLIFENHEEINWVQKFLVDNSKEDRNYVKYLSDNNPSNFKK